MVRADARPILVVHTVLAALTIVQLVRDGNQYVQNHCTIQFKKPEPKVMITPPV